MINRSWPKETREMRLFSRVIEQAHAADLGNTQDLDASLPELIARLRRPGESWATWDELRYALASISGEIVTEGTIKRWARWYGIPENTKPEDAKDEAAMHAYDEAIRSSGIKVGGAGRE